MGGEGESGSPVYEVCAQLDELLLQPVSDFCAALHGVS